MARPVEESFRKGSGASGECTLEVAVLFEATTHVAGVGWRVVRRGIPGTVKSETRRRGGTLIHSEVVALRRGLEAAADAGCDSLTVRIKDPRLIGLIQGTRPPRLRRAAAEVERLRPLLQRFGSLRFESRFVTDPELAHAVGEAMDAGLHAVADREKHRTIVMEQIVERAKGVRLEATSSGWVANGRYRVQLDPMRCECPAWTTRWARAPVAGRRAERLPCKHIVALALHEGVTVPADLARMARRALP